MGKDIFLQLAGGVESDGVFSRNTESEGVFNGPNKIDGFQAHLCLPRRDWLFHGAHYP